MQMQEDEIQLLKMALADVLKRLNISEEHQAAAAAGRRAPVAKGEHRSVVITPVDVKCIDACSSFLSCRPVLYIGEYIDFFQRH